MYPLSDFVTVEETEDTSVIQHKNGERTAELQVYAADEAELETLISKYSETLKAAQKLSLAVNRPTRQTSLLKSVYYSQ